MEDRRTFEAGRVQRAGSLAGTMVDALVAAAPWRSDDDLEDEFCERFGVTMEVSDGRTQKEWLNPDDLATAVLLAIDERLKEAGADVVVLRRVLAVVAGVLPAPLSGHGGDLVADHLDAAAVRRVSQGRAVTGPVLWARDVYGCRRAVVAPFASDDDRDRWYLWDVDACGYNVVTVDSGFYPTAELALAAWQESVGHAAAGAATLTTVDDAETLADLLIAEIEQLRSGGEDKEQYIEFLRGRRLAQSAREAVGPTPGAAPLRLTTKEAAKRFAQRLRQHGQTGPSDLDERAAALAQSWFPSGLPTLYPYCSPHKVARVVRHLQDFYQHDWATQLIAAVPEWIRFLAEQNGMTAELTERCLAYASGELHFPGEDWDLSEPMARVIE